MKTKRFWIWMAMFALAAGCSQEKNGGSTGGKDSQTSSPVPVDTIGRGPWHWIVTVTPTARIACDNPATYALTFLPDSTVRLLIDCNRGSGPYHIDGHAIHIGPLATTRMMCPPGSMDAAFAANINAVQSWSHNADTLQLEMQTGGSMLLVR